MVRQTLLKGTIIIDIGATAGGFCSNGERLSTTPNTRKSGIFIPKEQSSILVGRE